MLVFGLAAGRRVPPLARPTARSSRPTRSLHVLEGTLVIADPETGEVQRVETGEQRLLPPRHVAPRLRARRRAAAGARAVRAAAGGGRVERVRAAAAVPRGQRATPTTRSVGALAARARPPAARLHVAAPGRRPVAARPRRPVRDPRQHRAPHGRAARDRAGRGRRPHAHGGDEVLMALDGPLWVRAWHDGRRPRVRARARGRLLPAGRLPARVPQRGGRCWRARSAGSPRATCRDAALAVGIDVGATKLAAALVDLDSGARSPGRRASGRPARTAAPTRCSPTASRWRARSRRGRPVAAVGLGVCELVDPEGASATAETLDWRDDRPRRRVRAASARCTSSPTSAPPRSPRRGTAPARRLPLRQRRIRDQPLPRRRRACRARVRAAARSTPARRWSSGGRAASRSRAAAATPAPRRRSPTRRPPRSSRTAPPAWARCSRRSSTRSTRARSSSAAVSGCDAGYRNRVVAAMRAAVYDDAVRDLPVRAAFLGAEGGVVGAALAAGGQRASVASIA